MPLSLNEVLPLFYEFNSVISMFAIRLSPDESLCPLFPVALPNLSGSRMSDGAFSVS